VGKKKKKKNLMRNWSEEREKEEKIKNEEVEKLKMMKRNLIPYVFFIFILKFLF
jgi:hypothetical protein